MMSDKNELMDAENKRESENKVTEKEDEKLTGETENDVNKKVLCEKEVSDNGKKDNEEIEAVKNLDPTAPTEEDVLRLLKDVKSATSEIKNIAKIEISLRQDSIDVIDFGDLTPDSELYVTSSLCSECASEENEKESEEEKKNENEDSTLIPSATSKTNETHSTSTETKKRWASIKRLLLFSTSRKKNK